MEEDEDALDVDNSVRGEREYGFGHEKEGDPLGKILVCAGGTGAILSL